MEAAAGDDAAVLLLLLLPLCCCSFQDEALRAARLSQRRPWLPWLPKPLLHLLTVRSAALSC
jgi:hypothetical protein